MIHVEINDSHSATHIYDCAREEERLLMTVGRAGGKRGGVSMLGMPHFHFLSFSEKIFRHENSTLWFLKLSLEKKILLFPFQENTLIARLLLLIYPWYAWECKAQKSQFLSLLLHFSPTRGLQNHGRNNRTESECLYVQAKSVRWLLLGEERERR